jgi:hypothetical protein
MDVRIRSPSATGKHEKFLLTVFDEWYSIEIRRLEMKTKKTIEAPEQTIKLSQCPNMMKAIASNILQHQEVYYCMFAGKRTAVVKD